MQLWSIYYFIFLLFIVQQLIVFLTISHVPQLLYYPYCNFLSKIKIFDLIDRAVTTNNFYSIWNYFLFQKKKENQITNGSTKTAAPPGPLDPFADDDEDQLRNIAKKFEEKYVGSQLPASRFISGRQCGTIS